jgi:hypothetical protein
MAKQHSLDGGLNVAITVFTLIFCVGVIFMIPIGVLRSKFIYSFFLPPTQPGEQLVNCRNGISFWGVVLSVTVAWLPFWVSAIRISRKSTFWVSFNFVMFSLFAVVLLVSLVMQGYSVQTGNKKGNACNHANHPVYCCGHPNDPQSECYNADQCVLPIDKWPQFTDQSQLQEDTMPASTNSKILFWTTFVLFFLWLLIWTMTLFFAFQGTQSEAWPHKAMKYVEGAMPAKVKTMMDVPTVRRRKKKFSGRGDV